MKITIASCTGGGSMERLARALSALGVEAQVLEGFSDRRWRELMASGGIGRGRARIGSMLVFPIRAIAHGFFRRRDVLVATTNPFYLPLVLIATRPLHRVPVVALVYDVYPDALEVSGVATPTGLLARIAAGANRFWLSRADAVVFIGPEMAEHVRGRYGSPPCWEVIETGASVSEFGTVRVHAADPESELERWCRGKVVASYVGNMGQMHDWETVCRAVPRVLADPALAPLCFVVAASGAGAETLARRWSDLAPDRVRFEPPLPDPAWVRLLSSSSIALVTLKEAASKTSIPSKTFSAMAAGNAVVAVAPVGSDLAAVVARERCGAVVSPGDVEGLVHALRGLALDPEALRLARDRGRGAVAARYDVAVLAGRWLALLTAATTKLRGRRLATAIAKRALDVGVAAAGLCVSAPLLGVVAAAIRVTMGSPVYFRQERPGRGARPFRIVKFRTMRDTQPGEDPLTSDAMRLTALGGWLRRTSLDELPTLWNVLSGDMSLVGPRPLLMRYLSRYSTQQARRHEVKPGLTGWAQVNGRNAISWEEKFQYDVWYVDHQSLLLDLRILARTVVKVLKGEGISAEDHATMPEFLGAGTKTP
jgi:lipopolysaccharide/colanic/teichoic acid biosynthesis glycosyltransferase/glycosyltransferase involved in cell wall biosynthesis